MYMCLFVTGFAMTKKLVLMLVANLRAHAEVSEFLTVYSLMSAKQPLLIKLLVTNVTFKLDAST